MAKAHSTQRSVPVTTYTEVTEITLTLSKEEAQVIADITDRIGGCPTSSRRGLIVSLAVALRSAGIAPNCTPRDIDARDLNTFYFTSLK